MKPSAARSFVVVSALAMATALSIGVPPVEAAIVPTVPLGTTAQYSVLAGSAVTNTGDSTLAQSLGVAPGTAISGFPPGLVAGTTHAADAEAAQAQLDLTVAYVDAANRPVDQTGPADLTGLNLQAGVYAASNKDALLLTGTLTLDGAGDPSSVFIFQTSSSFTTFTGSSVQLINGAQQCNIFWQVGSSATLGGADFTGNILAQASVTIANNVTVHGRALARDAAVTLIDDTFVAPTCDTTTPVTTAPGGITTPVAAPDQPVDGVPGDVTPGGAPGDELGNDNDFGDDLLDTTLPRTGASNDRTVAIATATLLLGAALVGCSRRQRPRHS